MVRKHEAPGHRGERERERENEEKRWALGSQLATVPVMRSSSEVLGRAERAGQKQQICQGQH